ncbi:hypothetical protein GCM10019016_062750 [Streptomyces prasinosporus]|uniref:Uncharacterized protein n=1 Tax=Streptomyces prasinosporus TaxID=68256 RepID=A0ABP6TXX4_9ACTN
MFRACATTSRADPSPEGQGGEVEHGQQDRGRRQRGSAVPGAHRAVDRDQVGDGEHFETGRLVAHRATVR